MTYLDAAYTILKAADRPLHYEEITKLALEQQLITPQGQTPAATMGSRLYTDTLQEGSRFVRVGKGNFLQRSTTTTPRSIGPASLIGVMVAASYMPVSRR